MRLKGWMTAAAACGAGWAMPADAAVTINIFQNAAGTIATSSGTLDLTGLTFIRNYANSIGVAGARGFVGFSIGGYITSAYAGFTGPSSFGTGPDLLAPTTTTGVPFAFNASYFGAPWIFVPFGFTSGSRLDASSTFAGQTLDSLGLTAGTYSYTSPADTITITIANFGVPEPATWALMVAGFGLAGAALRRRSRSFGALSAQLPNP